MPRNMENCVYRSDWHVNEKSRCFVWLLSKDVCNFVRGFPSCGQEYLKRHSRHVSSKRGFEANGIYGNGRVLAENDRTYHTTTDRWIYNFSSTCWGAFPRNMCKLNLRAITSSVAMATVRASGAIWLIGCNNSSTETKKRCSWSTPQKYFHAKTMTS